MTDTGGVAHDSDTRSTPGASSAPAGPAVGLAVEDWTGDARFFEYSAAVDPVGSGVIGPVPVHRFPASAHEGGPTRAVALDLSAELGVDYPATGPGLLAQFLCIGTDDSLVSAPAATSILAYCLRGRGSTIVRWLEGDAEVPWQAGDVIVVPGGARVEHRAQEAAVLYQVDDTPLLAYLGVVPAVPRFGPTRFDGAVARARLRAVAADPGASARSRVAVLLGNARAPRTLTATHTLWAMLGVLPGGALQRPHRHQSVALDLIVDCRAGCYSLVGAALDAHGSITDPVRVDWEPGGVFVTPPGLWHSHHNESDAPAHLLPVQDAGLHTYLRSLDIRFTAP